MAAIKQTKKGAIVHVATCTKKATAGRYRSWGPSDSLCDLWDAQMAQERAALAAKKEEVKNNRAAK